MVNFIIFLNKYSKSYILKGSTSLIVCYNSDRFPEDINLDALCSKNDDIIDIINNFCKQNNLNYRIAKNTDTVKRCMIHYNGKKPLKIEVSYRRKNIACTEYTIINNILVYTIQSLLMFKLNAYLNRDKIRDLYDITFICKNYTNYIPKELYTQLSNAISYKGIEYFDYIISTQSDELIDNDKLASDFLEMFYWLGLN